MTSQRGVTAALKGARVQDARASERGREREEVEV